MSPHRSGSRMSMTYRLVMWLVAPLVRGWGRLEVRGAGLLPLHGPVLLVSNHDSHWDPLVVGVAARRRRQIRALAKSSLWQSGVLAAVLRGMRQFPITRGRVVRTELAAVLAGLRAGDCVGIFPEGTISRGAPLRAYSGAGWIAGAVPQSRVLLVAITGAVDMVRFPRRPRITVEFFEPAGGQLGECESSIGFSRRVTAEIRRRSPYASAGRAATVPQPQPQAPVYRSTVYRAG
jgi:1-acyl-sn-glycerol-3-phosphate acyltransferase